MPDRRSTDRTRRDEAWNAAAIRRLRAHLGLTQAELADELNTRQQTISEWERGAYRPRGPSARLLTRVAEDVSFAYEPGAPSTTQNTARGSDEGDDRLERSHSSEPVSEHVSNHNSNHNSDREAGGEATGHVEPGR